MNEDTVGGASTRNESTRAKGSTTGQTNRGTGTLGSALPPTRRPGRMAMAKKTQLRWDKDVPGVDE
ncbi:MAG: hypothetical protein QF738_01100, partial [Rhodospirillales bacterium]|nr:hypothetical protein [Rhodospirillales bacterium]